ncbi:MAG TPA: D-alanyl-D-alanine carboxypeptidase [Pyrinomonadaceae bacterium]|nr:D-alanyl-D-alanine carboxypeptidase [Pyrinomonadaceae bacterium]
MKISRISTVLWLNVAVLTLGIGMVTAQSTSTARPLLQDIRVFKDEPVPAATPGVRRTASSSPVMRDDVSPAVLSANGVKTSIPLLAETNIPGYSGVIVESLEGNIVVEKDSHLPYNPASNVKIATTYAVLKAFGPDHRFPTNVWTDGAFEKETATLHGNLYITGRDPVFSYEDAIRIANELNRMGIRTIKGDLVVTDNFTINYQASSSRSAQLLFTTLDASKRAAAATRAWGTYRRYSVNSKTLNEIPNVSFTGSVYTQPMPTNVNMLFSHESAPMKDIIKAMMAYSNNTLSELLGDLVGGPYGIARTVHSGASVPPIEFNIQTASGLGINRVTPRAMLKVVRELRSDLERWKMTLADVMPVAGMDNGTLEGRFASDYSRGSVVGKTGTLIRTDAGASALSGEMNTRSGRFLFVIFNQRGNVPGFRSFQNNYISLIQGQFGGPASLGYAPVALEARLARTKVTFPESRARTASE